MSLIPDGKYKFYGRETALPTNPQKGFPRNCQKDNADLPVDVLTSDNK